MTADQTTKPHPANQRRLLPPSANHLHAVEKCLRDVELATAFAFTLFYIPTAASIVAVHTFPHSVLPCDPIQTFQSGLATYSLRQNLCNYTKRKGCRPSCPTPAEVQRHQIEPNNNHGVSLYTTATIGAPADFRNKAYGKPSASRTWLENEGIHIAPLRAACSAGPETPLYTKTYIPCSITRASWSSLFSSLRGRKLDDGRLHLHDSVYPHGSHLIG